MKAKKMDLAEQVFQTFLDEHRMNAAFDTSVFARNDGTFVARCGTPKTPLQKHYLFPGPLLWLKDFDLGKLDHWQCQNWYPVVDATGNPVYPDWLDDFLEFPLFYGRNVRDYSDRDYVKFTERDRWGESPKLSARLRKQGYVWFRTYATLHPDYMAVLQGIWKNTVRGRVLRRLDDPERFPQHLLK